MTQFAVSALIARKREIMGEKAYLEKKIDRCDEAMSHIDATIRLFDPEFDFSRIKPRRHVNEDEFFQPGEIPILALEVLRDAGRPLATNAINARLADGNTDDQQVAFGGSLPDIILQRTSKGGGGNGGGRCYSDRGPGFNEDCDVLAEKDEQMCRSLPLPRLRKPCWESAAQRNAACKAGRPMPPLNTGDW